MKFLFKKESHYLWATIALVFGHVLYMTYLFPRDWADTPTALALIDTVALVVPVLRDLQQHAPPYTHYWGVFYAIFWIMAPIYWALGLVGSFFLSPYRYEKLVVETSRVRVWAIFLMFSVLVAYEFSFPMISFGIFMNQMSNFLPKLILSWFVTAGCFYSHARVIGALILKFNLNRNH